MRASARGTWLQRSIAVGTGLRLVRARPAPRTDPSQRDHPRRPGPSWRPTCPRVPGLWPSSSLHAHPTASARFRARAQGPVSGRLSGTADRRSQPSRPGFRCLSARRRSLLDHPVPAGKLGLACGRRTGHAQAHPDPDGVLPRPVLRPCSSIPSAGVALRGINEHRNEDRGDSSQFESAAAHPRHGVIRSPSPAAVTMAQPKRRRGTKS
jgi:hypothetical protein